MRVDDSEADFHWSFANTKVDWKRKLRG